MCACNVGLFSNHALTLQIGFCLLARVWDDAMCHRTCVHTRRIVSTPSAPSRRSAQAEAHLESAPVRPSLFLFSCPVAIAHADRVQPS
jgi:hypothetical protein